MAGCRKAASETEKTDWQVDRQLITNCDELIRESIIQAACSEYRFKGQVVDFLRSKYEQLKEYGWDRKEFENIYQDVALRVKNKKFKQPLFN